MPFGAMESIAVHETLSEKIGMLDHFAVYAEQCQDPMLRQMIHRHMQSAIDSYNQLVSYTHDYRRATSHLEQTMGTPGTIQYGLRNPQPESPSMLGGRFSDKQIAGSVLSFHKNSAKNHMAAALECADPNIRQMMMNAAVTCCDQAYEVFLYMNQRGMYQVPTLNDNTAKTYLHHYQQANLQQVQNQPYGTQSYINQMPAQQGSYQGNPFLM